MNKTLPTLYGRGKKGQVLTWIIEIDGNKYRTITGAEDAKKVISEWTVCESKNVGRSNETSPQEQSLTEATSKWQMKKDKEHYFEDVKDIDVKNFVECMLAHGFEDRVKKGKISFPVMVDRKYNGMRQITTVDGPISRKGKPILSAPHIPNQLKPLFEEYPDLILDGELYNHELRYRLNDLMSLVRKTKADHITPDLLAESERIVRYYVYDGYGFDGVTEETPNIERRRKLGELLKKYSYVVVVDHKVANSLEDVYKIFNEYLDDGYEGAIVRVPSAPYEHSRSYNLLKVKPEDDDEANIIGVDEGTGNWSGAAFTFKVNWNGHIINPSIKNGSYEDRVEILKNPDNWIGKRVTFVHIGYTGKAVEGAPKGMPFSPRVDIKNCFKEDR